MQYCLSSKRSEICDLKELFGTDALHPYWKILYGDNASVALILMWSLILLIKLYPNQISLYSIPRHDSESQTTHCFDLRIKGANS